MKKLKNLDQLKLNKYKFIGFSVIAVLLITFVCLVLFNEEIVEGLILSATTASLFVLGITRLIAVFKSDKKQLKVLVNLIESIANVTIAIVILLIIPNPDASLLLVGLYCYLISAVLFGRGIVFFIEGMYCDEKKSFIKFIIHILLIVCATFFVARKMSLSDLTYVMAAIASLALIYSIVEVILSFKKYRVAKKEKDKNDLKETLKDEIRKELNTDTSNGLIDEIKEEIIEEMKDEVKESVQE